ncbi:MAG: hypothetical protein ACPG2Y_02775, partial [Acholeplasmataceae bacterium]
NTVSRDSNDDQRSGSDEDDEEEEEDIDQRDTRKASGNEDDEDVEEVPKYTRIARYKLQRREMQNATNDGQENSNVRKYKTLPNGIIVHPDFNDPNVDWEKQRMLVEKQAAEASKLHHRAMMDVIFGVDNDAPNNNNNQNSSPEPEPAQQSPSQQQQPDEARDDLSSSVKEQSTEQFVQSPEPEQQSPSQQQQQQQTGNTHPNNHVEDDADIDLILPSPPVMNDVSQNIAQNDGGAGGENSETESENLECTHPTVSMVARANTATVLASLHTGVLSEDDSSLDSEMLLLQENLKHFRDVKSYDNETSEDDLNRNEDEDQVCVESDVSSHTNPDSSVEEHYDNPFDEFEPNDDCAPEIDSDGVAGVVVGSVPGEVPGEVLGDVPGDVAVEVEDGVAVGVAVDVADDDANENKMNDFMSNEMDVDVNYYNNGLSLPKQQLYRQLHQLQNLNGKCITDLSCGDE